MATEEELRVAIRAAAREGRADCAVLLDLARRTATSPREIGRLCDELGVRVSNCQLGCFGGGKTRR